MLISKRCECCGKTYEIPHWREHKSKYCSRKCSDLSKKANNNVVCAICGKPFHLKQSHIDRYDAKLGFCCSKECHREQMKIRMAGSGNHQYGLKGRLNASFKEGVRISENNSIFEEMYYVGDWYKKNNEHGRVKYHRYLVELNHTIFDNSFFEEIDGWFYLKDGYVVHHKDFNHSNNDLTNLQVVTKSEHIRIHNLANPRKRNSKNGQFIKSL